MNIHDHVYKMPLFDTVHSKFYAYNSYMEHVKCQNFVMNFSMKLKTGAEDGRCVRCGCICTATSIFYV